MADHPLRPATDRRLGKPLPHQLANRTSAAPQARGRCRSPAFLSRAYAVLAYLSIGYPPLQDTFRCVTHPFATRRQGCPRVTVRLACVKHAASVQSEPGSNSSVQSIKTRINLRNLPPALTEPEANPITVQALPYRSLRTQASPTLSPPTINKHPSARLRHKAPTLIGC